MADRAEKSRRDRREPHPLAVLAGVLAAFLLLAACYVGYQALHILFPQNVYETALPATVSDNVEADGVLLFDEVYVSGSGTLGYLAADGERVSAGTAVAEIYSDASQAVLRQQLTQLTEQLVQLQGGGVLGALQQVDLIIDLGQLLAQGGLRCIAVDLSHRCACRDTLAIGHQISQRAAARNVAFLKQEHAFGIHSVLHRSQQGGLVSIGRKQHLHCLIAHIQCRQQQKHDDDSGQRFQCAGDALAVFFLHIAHPFAKNSFVRHAACSRTSGAEASSQQMPSMWRNQVSWRLA